MHQVRLVAVEQEKTCDPLNNWKKQQRCNVLRRAQHQSIVPTRRGRGCIGFWYKLGNWWFSLFVMECHGHPAQVQRLCNAVHNAKDKADRFHSFSSQPKSAREYPQEKKRKKLSDVWKPERNIAKNAKTLQKLQVLEFAWAICREEIRKIIKNATLWHIWNNFEMNTMCTACNHRKFVFLWLLWKHLMNVCLAPLAIGALGALQGPSSFTLPPIRVI